METPAQNDEGHRLSSALNRITLAQASRAKRIATRKPPHRRRSDLSPYIVWTAIVGLILGLVYYFSRIARKGDEQSRHDMGTAIVEFGRAFPEEAIRNLHVTVDGNIFVRLHDNKTGFMRNRRAHYACHLIQPGRVRLIPLPSAKGFTAEFLDSPTQNGEFVFSSEKEAAEVSLWLLDNYVSVADRNPDPAVDDAVAEREDATTTDRAN
jgi:hypothetical protein